GSGTVLLARTLFLAPIQLLAAGICACSIPAASRPGYILALRRVVDKSRRKPIACCIPPVSFVFAQY
ncbi:hypothetical protein, partial [Legionella shakespearei]|uniref:hypothetical protein n=1 Tax=Legionella shakespearei TaxID=45075 RepID=UPI001ED989E0